ncbi:MAG: hypothetical protein MJZ62_05850 [Bacteroidales bacterium]|nr:hypothetical protein [Bacteroidales bacterium]
MKTPNLRFIFSCVGIGLSIASVVLLIVMKDIDTKAILTMLSLALTAVALSQLDSITEKKEEEEDQ